MAENPAENLQITVHGEPQQVTTAGFSAMDTHSSSRWVHAGTWGVPCGDVLRQWGGTW